MVALGSQAPGLSGTLGTVTFRTLRAGDPRIRVRSVRVRGDGNQPLDLTPEVTPRAEAIPLATSFEGASPNPFRDNSSLRFGLARAGTVEMAVYSVDGRRVRTLASGTFAAGYHRIPWDGRDDHGSTAASGVYYVRLVTSGESFVNKLVRVR